MVRHQLGQGKEGPQRIVKNILFLSRSHFIDKRTDTQRKGMNDLQMTLELAEKKKKRQVYLVSRSPGTASPPSSRLSLGLLPPAWHVHKPNM
jgi:hypothetical protein